MSEKIDIAGICTSMEKNNANRKLYEISTLLQNKKIKNIDHRWEIAAKL